MNVLIAEDDDVSRRLLETILRLLGRQIVAVTDGTQAWSALDGQSPPKKRRERETRERETRERETP